MTTYSEFQEAYTRLMWRTGDADWAADLPSLMKKAEARIRRDLYHTSLIMETEGIATDPNEIPLTGDVREIVSLQFAEGTSDVYGATIKFRDGANHSTSPGIAVRAGDKLLVQTGATTTTPSNYKLRYVMGITPYSDDPALPFYDTNPDFYEAALGVPAYKYLKDFAQANEANASYLDTLDSMRAESEYRKYPSGQISVQVPGNVA